MTENQSSDTIARILEEIEENITRACAQSQRSRNDVRLMAVTKTVEASRVNEAIAAGVTLLGENKAQELLAKYDDYHKENAEIHFIGHLQTNKVRQIIDKVTMIQSLDSTALAQEIQKQCEKHQKTMDCLVEVNIGSEFTKSGIEMQNLERFLEELVEYDRLHIRGIMSIPPVCETDKEKEQNFAKLYKLFVDMREKKIDNINMEFLSMGMSDDYQLAIKHGSTLVRLGTVIFGRRNYA